MQICNKYLTSQPLSSSCWENGDEITIRATLRNINTGEFLASAVVEFLKTNMRDTITYQPRDYAKAQDEKKAFNPQYIVSEPTRSKTEPPKTKVLTEYEFSPIGGLKVDLWTDKGRGPLSYTEGDKVKIFAHVDQPVYLRLLNIHADQKRTLLVDNFYISPSQVNSGVEIGEFLCAPPFGTEFVVVAARTDKFPTIETYEEEGYIFLVDQDPKKAAASFRGLSDGRALKPKPEERDEQQSFGPQPIIDKQPSFQQNEAQLVITTMEK